MTISTVYEPDVYNGDDSTDTFPITFEYLSTSTYIKVSVRDTDQVLTEKTASTHYNVSSDNVVFTAGNIPATGEVVIIELDPDFKQQSDYAENDTFPAETLEDDLDKLCLEVQMLLDSRNRSIRVAADQDLDDLDLEDYINSAFDLDITEHWTTATAALPNALRFNEATANGTNYVKLQAPATVASDVTLTLPGTDGNADQVLGTDGSGVLSWVDKAWSDYTIPSDGSSGQFLQTDGAATLSWADEAWSDYTIPSDGSNGQVLQTNGSGTLSWATQSSWGDDNYETGTWTPVINSSNSNLTTSGYTTQVGNYTKIGNVVYASANVTGTVSAVGTGNVVITGLPYSSKNTTNLNHRGHMAGTNGYAGKILLGCKILANTSIAYLRGKTNFTDTLGYFATSDINASGHAWELSIVYIVE